MNIKLNCHVCGYQEIESNTCPNCDTDLSLMRILQELPEEKKSFLPANFAPWPLGISLLILIIGMGLGMFGSFFIVEPNLYTTAVSRRHSVVMNPEPIANPVIAPEKPPELNTYTVKAGDSLSAIAKSLCGKATLWPVIVNANPQLQGRENNLDVGDKLIIPNCQEKTP